MNNVNLRFLAGDLPLLAAQVNAALCPPGPSESCERNLYYLLGEEKPEAVIAEFAGKLGELSETLPEGETFFALRTSGSTRGRGRIVILSASALRASSEATQKHLHGEGVWVCALPTHHVAGFLTVVRSLLAGTNPVSAGRGDAMSLLEAAQQARSLYPHTHRYLSLVPTQLFRLVHETNAKLLEEVAASYAAVLVGGASCSPALLEAARGVGLRIVTTYGMSETCGGCVYDGVPVGNTQITLTDEGTWGKGRGLVQIHSSQLAYSYLGEKPFNGVVPTQDVAMWTPEGTLKVLGRVDDAINSGGMTIFPRPLEEAAAKLTGWAAIAVGVPDEEWGERVVLVAERPYDGLREDLRTYVERTSLPHHIYSLADLGLEAFPTLPSGKISRKAIRERIQAVKR